MNLVNVLTLYIEITLKWADENRLLYMKVILTSPNPIVSLLIFLVLTLFCSSSSWTLRASSLVMSYDLCRWFNFQGRFHAFIRFTSVHQHKPVEVRDLQVLDEQSYHISLFNIYQTEKQLVYLTIFSRTFHIQVRKTWIVHIRFIVSSWYYFIVCYRSTLTSFSRFIDLRSYLWYGLFSL